MESIVEQFPTGGVHCQTALIDVTEARADRMQLQDLNEELEHRINLRAADLRRRTEQLVEQSAELVRSHGRFGRW
jgi:hypothetical protein